MKEKNNIEISEEKGIYATPFLEIIIVSEEQPILTGSNDDLGGEHL